MVTYTVDAANLPTVQVGFDGAALITIPIRPFADEGFKSVVESWRWQPADERFRIAMRSNEAILIACSADNVQRILEWFVKPFGAGGGALDQMNKKYHELLTQQAQNETSAKEALADWIKGTRG